MRRLVSADAHIGIPLSVADELPDHYRERVPHLEPRSDGLFAVYPRGLSEGNRTESGRQREVLVDGDSIERICVANSKVLTNPSSSPTARLEEMHREGVVAEVLVSPVTGSHPDDDPDLERAYAQVRNDWLAETFKDHLDRFAPGAHLPTRTVTGAVAELERVAALGLRPALLPEGVLDRPYNDQRWEPLWEALEGLGIPVAFHVGGLRGPVVMEGAGHAQTTYSFVCVGTIETVSLFVNGGVLARHPGLRLVFTECEAGWLAWAMQHWDYVHDARFPQTAGTGMLLDLRLPQRPSHYVRQQVKCTFMFDPVAIRNRDVTGTKCLLWGGDYPHEEGVSPYSQQAVAQQFVDVPEDEIDKMTRTNTAEIYGLDPS